MATDPAALALAVDVPLLWHASRRLLPLADRVLTDASSARALRAWGLTNVDEALLYGCRRDLLEMMAEVAGTPLGVLRWSQFQHQQVLPVSARMSLIFVRGVVAVLLAALMHRQRGICVAGMHGKTTTTSILTWILEHAGLSPGFLIGGVPANFGSSARLGAAPFFVIEADEYDTAFFDKGPKFLHYLPRIVLLKNIEFDHADIYADMEALRIAFRRLVGLIPRHGRLILGADSAEAARLASLARCPAETFGVSEAADRAGVEIPVLIEFDSGMGRCGVQTPAEAADLAGDRDSCGMRSAECGMVDCGLRIAECGMRWSLW